MHPSFKLVSALFCALLSFIFSVQHAYAVPAVPAPVIVTQPDGTTLTIRIYGDDFGSYRTTSDGIEIVQQADGFYYYATRTGSGVRSTGVVAKDPEKRGIADQAVLPIVTRGNVTETFIGPLSDASSLRKIPDLSPVQQAMASRSEQTRSGTKYKSLVILVNFADLKFTSETTAKADFTRLLNQDGYSYNEATGSAWNYYYDNSNGRFNPEFVVAGPYTLSQSMSYYGAKSGSENDIRPREMIEEACRLADADVNFAEYADDGWVRDVFIFYAGYAESNGGPTYSIWPHRWYLSSPITLDGASVFGYACASELYGSSGSTRTGIGTFCHEFGHVLGWPDLYDADYSANGQSLGMSFYSLMAAGNYNNSGRTPPALTALERYMVGWVEPEPLSAQGDYELDLIYNDKAYIIETRTAGEYYLLEARSSRNSKWDEGLEKDYKKEVEGLLVTHIDQSANRIPGTSLTASSLWTSNLVNGYSEHPCARIVRAIPSNTLTDWIFPQSSVSTLSGETHSEFIDWNGYSLKRTLNEIQFTNNKVRFSMEADNSLSGTISDIYGKKINKARVTLTRMSEGKSHAVGGKATTLMAIPLLQTRASVDYSCFSNADGMFEFDDLSSGTYQLFISSEGYSDHVSVIDLPSPAHLSVTLTKPAEAEMQQHQWYNEFSGYTMGMTDGRAYIIGSRFNYSDFGQTGKVRIASSSYEVKIAADLKAMVYNKSGNVIATVSLGRPDAGSRLSVDLSGYDIVLENADDYVILAYHISNYTSGVGGTGLGKCLTDGKGNLIRLENATNWSLYSNDQKYCDWLIGAGYSTAETAARVELLQQQVDLSVGGMERLEYELLPAGSSARLTWTSSDPEVVSVEAGGILRGLKAGSATITLSSADFSGTKSCRVTVSEEIRGKLTIALNESNGTAQVSWTPAVERETWVVRWKNDTETTYNRLETQSTSVVLPDISARGSYEVLVSGKRLDGENWGATRETFGVSAVEASTVSLLQNDAEFSWEDSTHEGNFIVTVYQGTTQVFRKTVDEKYIYVPVLSAGKEYRLVIEATGTDEEEKFRELVFKTPELTSPFASIRITGSYTTEENIPLRVINISGEPSSVNWQADGKSITPPTVSLSAGKHTITVTVTKKNGDKETLTKIITVK